MSLGISIDVITAKPAGLTEKIARVADRIVFDRLLAAKGRLIVRSPVDTSTLMRSWSLTRLGAFRYRIENNARSDYGEYAGYVFRKGDKSRTPYIADMVRDEIRRAIREVQVQVGALATTGAAPVRPSVRAGTLRESLIDRLRAIIAEQLRATTPTRTSQTRIAA